MITPLLPCRAMREWVLAFHHENLVRFQWWSPSKFKLAPAVSHSQATPHLVSGNSSKLTFKCSYLFMVHQLLLLGSRPQLWLSRFVSLFKFQGRSLSCTSVLWGVQEKSLTFSSFSFILMLGWEWWPPSSFICQKWKVSKVSIQ